MIKNITIGGMLSKEHNHTMKRYVPAKSALISIRFIMLILAAAITVISYIFLNNYTIIMWIIIFVCWGTAILYGFIFIPIYFRNTVYNISETDIRKKTGMLFFSKQFMKMRSIQYISTIITPFSKLTGLNFIIVNAWGGRMVFCFLNREETLEISSHLDEFIKNNV